MEGSPDSELRRLTERLQALSGELAADPSEERAAELVREASKLAAEAGEEADRILAQASGLRESAAAPEPQPADPDE
jgi:hypothetical protein